MALKGSSSISPMGTSRAERPRSGLARREQASTISPILPMARNRPAWSDLRHPEGQESGYVSRTTKTGDAGTLDTHAHAGRRVLGDSTIACCNETRSTTSTASAGRVVRTLSCQHRLEAHGERHDLPPARIRFHRLRTRSCAAPPPRPGSTPCVRRDGSWHPCRGAPSWAAGLSPDRVRAGSAQEGDAPTPGPALRLERDEGA